MAFQTSGIFFTFKHAEQHYQYTRRIHYCYVRRVLLFSLIHRDDERHDERQ